MISGRDRHDSTLSIGIIFREHGKVTLLRNITYSCTQNALTGVKSVVIKLHNTEAAFVCSDALCVTSVFTALLVCIICQYVCLILGLP